MKKLFMSFMALFMLSVSCFAAPKTVDLTTLRPSDLQGKYTLSIKVIDKIDYEDSELDFIDVVTKGDTCTVYFDGVEEDFTFDEFIDMVIDIANSVNESVSELLEEDGMDFYGNSGFVKVKNGYQLKYTVTYEDEDIFDVEISVLK